jgi:hypothetical protein
LEREWLAIQPAVPLFYLATARFGSMDTRNRNPLPKWPFLAGDLILVGLAVFLIVWQGGPLDASTAALATLLGVIGCGLGLLPFVIDYIEGTRRDLEAERAEVRGLAARLSALGRDLDVAAQSVREAVAAAENAAKTGQALPGRMQAAVLDLERRVSNVNSENSERFQMVGEQLERAIRQFTEGEETLSKIGRTSELLLQEVAALNHSLARAEFEKRESAKLAESMKATEPPESGAPKTKPRRLPFAGMLAGSLLQPQTPAVERIIARGKSGEPALAATEVPAMPEPASESSPADPSPADASPPATVTPVESTLSQTPPEPIPAPEPAPSDFLPDLDIPPVPRPHTPKFSPSKDAPVLIVKAFIGIGNKLTVRGRGPGLSEEAGAPMVFLEIGKWAWSPPEGGEAVEVEVLRNDTEPASCGRIRIEPGQTLEINPSF